MPVTKRRTEAGSEVGKFLRRFRAEYEITQQAMAERIDLSMQYLSAMELGDRDMPQWVVERIIERCLLDPKEEREIYLAFVKDAKQITIPLNPRTDQDEVDILIHMLTCGGLWKDQAKDIKERLGI